VSTGSSNGSGSRSRGRRSRKRLPGRLLATDETDAPVQRPRLSIVILPFLNLSQDPSVDYLVDGVVDSLITDLSRALPGSFVISRSTAFTYKADRQRSAKLARSSACATSWKAAYE